MTKNKEIVEKLEETEEKEVKKPKEKKTKKIKKKTLASELDKIMGTTKKAKVLSEDDEVPEFMSLEENEEDIPDYLKY